MKIQAAVTRTAGQPFAIEPVEIDDPQPAELLVRLVATGLCHTDLAVRDQNLPSPLPIVLGHEGAGIVERVGSAVTDFAVGNRVVLSFAACRNCARCDAGEPGYCAAFFPLNFGGCREDGSSCLHGTDGKVASHFFGQSSFASHALVAAKNAVKVPDDAPLELLGPLGCGIMTGAGAVFHSLAMQEGETLLVTGGGPVGLSAVMAGVVRSGRTIIVSDPLPARRAIALDLGATHAIDPADGNFEAQFRAILPDGADCVLDTSGVPAVIGQCIAALGVRGRMGMVGVPKQLDATFTAAILPMLSLGARICGITEGDADPRTFLPELIALHAAGRFPFDRMITTYPLDQINQAVEDQLQGRCTKAVLTM